MQVATAYQPVAKYLDTLVLIKLSDILAVLQQFNSFHPQIKFTHEEFTDDNDIHFLDIKISSSGTSICRKSTHTGQYQSISPASLHGAVKLHKTHKPPNLPTIYLHGFICHSSVKDWNLLNPDMHHQNITVAQINSVLNLLQSTTLQTLTPF
jgi:hypothetical protein